MPLVYRGFPRGHLVCEERIAASCKVEQAR